MTLGGFALITGPLIDKAVVAFENIERHQELGASVHEASERGVSEVTLPVLMASLALIVVFFPVTFFKGSGSSFYPNGCCGFGDGDHFLLRGDDGSAAIGGKTIERKAWPWSRSCSRTFRQIVKKFNVGFSKLRDDHYMHYDRALKSPKVIVALSVMAVLLWLIFVSAIGNGIFSCDRPRTVLYPGSWRKWHPHRTDVEARRRPV